MVVIPAGDFMMGRSKLTDDDKTGMRPLILRDDLPYHKVWLDAYFMDVKEVTHAGYAKFVEATQRQPPYHWLEGKYPESHELYPVYNVNWDDAGSYCAWQGKRLPTEAEWERAARAGNPGRDYPGGDSMDSEKALFNVNTGPGPVGEFSANDFGLYDMAGSVSEWCSDWFDRTYYEGSPERNPQGPAEGLYKMIRGGRLVRRTKARDGLLPQLGPGQPAYAQPGVSLRARCRALTLTEPAAGVWKALDPIPPGRI